MLVITLIFVLEGSVTKKLFHIVFCYFDVRKNYAFTITSENCSFKETLNISFQPITVFLYLNKTTGYKT